MDGHHQLGENQWKQMWSLQLSRYPKLSRKSIVLVNTPLKDHVLVRRHLDAKTGRIAVTLDKPTRPCTALLDVTNHMKSLAAKLRESLEKKIDPEEQRPTANRGCHTFSDLGEWVLGEWRMRKKRSQ